MDTEPKLNTSVEQTGVGVTTDKRTAVESKKSPNLWQRIRASIPFWRQQLQTKPDDVIQQIASSEEKSDTGNKEEQTEFRQLKPGEALEGEMPVLSQEDTIKYNRVVETLYGRPVDNGKWSTILDSGDGFVTKIFNQPNSTSAACESVFMSRFGGRAGLPKVIGVVPNGYKMEKIVGVKLSSLITAKIKNGNLGTESKVISNEQAQQLLNTVAEYHKVTNRVHGDLATAKGTDNIMVAENGEIRILDTEWERIGTQTPESELRDLYDFLTRNLGLGELNLPSTITAEEASVGLNRFKDEVNSMLTRDDVHRHNVVKINGSMEVKLSDSGEVLVRSTQK